MIDFADMDRDGMPDMVYYDQNHKSIMTFYNKHSANQPNELNLCKSAASGVR
jgi:hypothetical protein